MNQVLVNVYVPSIQQSFDVFVPVTVPVITVSELVKKAVSELTEKRFPVETDAFLCMRDSGEVLDINKSIYEQGVVTGSRLMLV